MHPRRRAPRGRIPFLALAALALLGALVAPPAGRAEAATTNHVVGADISWPQCPDTVGIPARRGQNQPMPPKTSDFVVVGVTNGIAFTPNPCIGRHMAWVTSHHVYAAAYAMTTYPRPRQLDKYGAHGPYDRATPAGRLRNAGYNQARFNVRTMKQAGLDSPVVWVDVEPSTVAPWSGSKAGNRAVFEGVVRGYRDAGYKVGIYSTQYLWQGVLGGVRYGLPEWRTAGGTSMSAALGKCSGSTVQGGPGVMAQWWTSSRDLDVACPRHDSRSAMRSWFHKY